MAVPDHEVAVPDKWIDYNDHLTEGYYGVAFADAGDWLLLQAGFDEPYRAREGGTFYTVEAHTWFRKEVAAGAKLAIRTTVLGVDAKRLHLLHEMFVDGDVCARQESMLLHVDTASGRVEPMAPAMLERLAALADEHAGRARPPGLSTGVRGLPDRSV